MKRTLSIVLLLILSLSLASCGLSGAPAIDTPTGPTEEVKNADTQNAEDALTSAMEAVKNGDIEKTKEYFGGSSLSWDENADASDVSFIEKNFSILFTKLSYDIGLVEEDGDTATAKIKITNINMTNVYYDSINTAIDMLLLEDAEAKSKEAQVAMISENIVSQIEEEENLVTTKVTLTMNRKYGEWTIESSKEFIIALMGGLDPTTDK